MKLQRIVSKIVRCGLGALALWLVAGALRAQPGPRPEAPAPRCSPAAGAYYAPALLRFGYWRYRGQVAGQPATLELHEAGYGPAYLQGSYYYERHGLPLPLEVWCYQPGQPLFMGEQVLAPEGYYFKASGFFRARQARGPHLAGTWANADSTFRTRFAFDENYEGAARLRFVNRQLHGPVATYDSAGQLPHQPLGPLYNIRYVQYRRPGQPDTAWHSLGPAREADMPAYAARQLALPANQGPCHVFVAQAVWLNAYGLLSVGGEGTRVRYNRRLGEPGAVQSWAQSQTIDLTTGRLLTLTDLLGARAQPALQALLARHLLAELRQRDQHSAGLFKRDPAHGPVPGAGFRWPLPAAGLALTPTGLVAIYQPDEIGPWRTYAAYLNVPWAELVDLLPARSALWRIPAVAAARRRP